ncbi:MAG TPA: MerR family transcriptional regulator [Cyclobacteriaceae bacterium]|nr:MerR family transcriptional regulator [Cyclobacteriaceae bacterium]
MGQYSIKELEKLSGIKAHTIRIWEKRYRIVAPQRTSTNIRYYSDDDLKKIINVSVLNNNGVKISKIADLSHEELVKRVGELSDAVANTSVHIDRLIVAMVDLNEGYFEKILAEIVGRMGFERTITEVVYPFLDKIGLLWQTGNISPAQEHFISNLIRQKIIVAIDGLPIPSVTRPSALLFLPEGELHELGLLFYHYIARRENFRTFYLGQTAPLLDILSINEKYQPRFLITSITNSPSPQSVQGYLNRLCKECADAIILASGSALRKTALKMPKNLHFFSNIRELRTLLKGN